MTNVQKAYDAEVDDASPKRRTLSAIITTDSVDRMGEVVSPKGLNLKAYLKNPVVLWAHGMDPAAPNLPIGKTTGLSMTADGRGLRATMEFAPGEFADHVMRLYQGGFLKAFSIGFSALSDKMGPPTVQEIKARPELAACRRIYRAGELHEYSAVPIGANPDALADAVAKGLWVPQAASAAPADLPSLAGCRTLSQAILDVSRATLDAAAAHVADRLDLMRGRV